MASLHADQAQILEPRDGHGPLCLLGGGKPPPSFSRRGQLSRWLLLHATLLQKRGDCPRVLAVLQAHAAKFAAHKYCNRRRNGRTGGPGSPTLCPGHPAADWPAAATGARLAACP